MAREKTRRPREEARPFANAIRLWAYKQNLPPHRWEIGGSWRREAPTIGDLDVMVITDDGTFADLEMPPGFVAEKRGPNIIQGELTLEREILPEFPIEDSMHVDFWACRPEARGAFLCFITGPKSLNIQQRAKAVSMGLTLSQYGLFDASQHQLDNGTEVSIYSLLHLPYLNPTRRQQYADKEPEKEAKRLTVQVPSDSDPSTEYTVSVKGDFWTCTCMAFKYSRSIPATCKHIKRVRAQLAEELRKRGVELEDGNLTINPEEE